MPRICCVLKCNTVENSLLNRSFFKFPSEERLRTAWELRCRGDGWKSKQHSLVCELHFKESDFIIRAKPAKLKPNAIPSIFENNMKRKYVEIIESDSRNKIVGLRQTTDYCLQIRVEILEERVRILEAEKNALLLQLGRKITACKERGVQTVVSCASKATQSSCIPDKSTAVQKQETKQEKTATIWTSILKNPVTSHRPTAQSSLNKYKDEGTVFQTGQAPESSDIKWESSVENLVSPNLLKIENGCLFYKPSETITPDSILPDEPCETITAGNISLDKPSETVTPNSSLPDAYLHIKIKEERVD